MPEHLSPVHETTSRTTSSWFCSAFCKCCAHSAWTGSDQQVQPFPSENHTMATASSLQPNRQGGMFIDSPLLGRLHLAHHMLTDTHRMWTRPAGYRIRRCSSCSRTCRRRPSVVRTDCRTTNSDASPPPPHPLNRPPRPFDGDGQGQEEGVEPELQCDEHRCKFL